MPNFCKGCFQIRMNSRVEPFLKPDFEIKLMQLFEDVISEKFLPDLSLDFVCDRVVLQNFIFQITEIAVR